MTEQEAKMLASEFEYNRDWRVTRVYQSILPPLGWCVFLTHRQKARWVVLTSADPRQIKRDLAFGEGVTAIQVDLK